MPRCVPGQEVCARSPSGGAPGGRSPPDAARSDFCPPRGNKRVRSPTADTHTERALFSARWINFWMSPRSWGVAATSGHLQFTPELVWRSLAGGGLTSRTVPKGLSPITWPDLRRGGAASLRSQKVLPLSPCSLQFRILVRGPPVVAQ